MPDKPKVNASEVESKIYLLRSQRVMLDFDLARIFDVETRVLNQSVKRNAERFPEDFMFRVSEEEMADLQNSSQFVMSSSKQRGAKYRPYAFTEHGVVMLAAVLRSNVAIEASILVVRAFVRLRNIFNQQRDLALKVERLKDSFEIESAKQNKQIATLFEAIRNLIVAPENEKRRIGFLDQSDMSDE